MTGFNTPYPLNLTGDFESDEKLLKLEIEKMPVLKYFNGWIYLTFQDIEYQFPRFFKKEKGTGFINDSLVFSTEREEFVTDGSFWNSINFRLENLIETLPRFHMLYEVSNRNSLGKFYSYCLFYLAGKIKSNDLNKYSIEFKELNIQKLKDRSRLDTDKLNQSLLSLLNNLGLKHVDYWEELSEEYYDANEGEIVVTYSLVDVETFEHNLNKIIKKLCTRFIDPSTEEEHLEQLFSGGKELMIPIRWVSSASHLNHFLKQLYKKNKIANGNYFKLAESLFVDANGNPFHNLKNNHSKATHNLELDQIIKLF